MTDVTVHIDPENDETDTPSGDAPMRGVILERLRSHWRGITGSEKIENVALHCFDGKIKLKHGSRWIPCPISSKRSVLPGRWRKRRAKMSMTEVKVLFY